MPVQINEVVIKAHIREPGETGKAAAGGSGGGGMNWGGGSKEEIIKECVEAVLELLNRKNER